MLTSKIVCVVIFNSVYLPDNTFRVVDLYNISWLSSQQVFDFEIPELFNLQTNTTIRVAIGDIKFACIEPDLSGLFAYRAIEVIMHSFREFESERRDHIWAKFRESLNLDFHFFDFVKSFSEPNRHGKPIILSVKDRQNCIHTAMIVLQRFMHYIQGGNTKLDRTKFPILNDLQQ